MNKINPNNAKKLFILAIGGTGSRVLKSLAMLLAAGVESDSVSSYEIVPIIIDPHKSNHDLSRTVKILDHYQTIRKLSQGGSSGFFATEISTLDSLKKSSARASTFSFELHQVANARFKNYIGYDHMTEASRALTEVLFSGETIDQQGRRIPLIDVEMDIGFVGNPNIGSVVLNQFAESQEFKDIVNNFSEGDRVFIISSIFGGTGAAGFPVILKNLRDVRNSSLEGRSFVRNAAIGAITVMPYFNIESENDSPIRRSDFVSKTKAALSYYRRNVTGNNSLNALYYIADKYQGKPYPNDPGTGGQANDAHFVEVAAALAIIDFMKLTDKELETIDGKASKPLFKEFAVQDPSPKLTFGSLHTESEKMLRGPLSKFYLMYRYMSDPSFERNENQHPWRLEVPRIDNDFLNSDFYRTLKRFFNEYYIQWLRELAANRRAFMPLNIGSEHTIENPIADRAPKKTLFKSFSYDKIDGALNKCTKTRQYSLPAEKILSVFDEATSQLLAEYFYVGKE